MTRNWASRGYHEFDLDHILFRVAPGGKKPAAGGHIDRILEWHTPCGWRMIRFETVGVMADFLMWNEDGLYPPAFGYKGGRKLLEYLRHAYRADIDKAEAGLRAEKSMKRTLFDEVEL